MRLVVLLLIIIGSLGAKQRKKPKSPPIVLTREESAKLELLMVKRTMPKKKDSCQAAIDECLAGK